MRLIRLKIDPAVSIKLKHLAAELKATPDFVHDVFALIRLKGNGLPSAKREQKLIDALGKSMKSQINARIFVRKTVQVLKTMVGMPYFTSVSRLPNPIFATEKILVMFNKVGARVRQSQCQSCQHAPKCDFGQQYQSLVTDVTKVVDPDFAKKAHPDCPHLPELDYTNKVNEAMKMLAQLFSPQNQQQNQALTEQMQKDSGRIGQDLDMSALDELEDLQQQNDPENAEEDEDTEELDAEKCEEDFTPSTVSGCSKGTRFDGSFTAEYYVKVQDTMINSLLAMGLDIFEIAQNLDNLLTKGHSKDFKPTAEMSDNQESAQMKSLNEVLKMEPSQLALPDEVLETKIAKKEIIIRQDREPTKKRQLLYLLIDESGSMRTQIMGANKSILSRASFTTVLATGLLKKVRDDDGIVFLRFFDNQPSPLVSMRNKDEFDAVIEKLRKCNYDGGGTNIQGAVRAAINDIKNANDEIAKAEILLITDADDHMTLNKADLNGIKMSVLDVAGANSYYALHYASDPQLATNVLKKCADAYYKADENNLNLKSIVGLVK